MILTRREEHFEAPLEAGGLFGRSIASIFHAPEYQCWTHGEKQRPDFAVTRLRSGVRAVEEVSAYPAAAVGQWRACYKGREFGVPSALPFATTVIDCNTTMNIWVDNWDPAVIDPLALGREVILFDNAGIGRSSGNVQAMGQPGLIKELSMKVFASAYSAKRIGLLALTPVVVSGLWYAFRTVSDLMQILRLPN